VNASGKRFTHECLRGNISIRLMPFLATGPSKNDADINATRLTDGFVPHRQVAAYKLKSKLQGSTLPPAIMAS
jgi:hypothetical protein